MQRKPNSRTLAPAFLVVSATLSLALLAFRNLYDDEISSFVYITLPFSGIIRALSRGDVHPPGMYLLGHLGLLIVHSFRWLNLFPLLFFYAGLSWFVLEIAPLFRRTQPLICFLLLATLHPQLLMWSNTFRWYSWWTSVALASLVVAIQPALAKPRLTPPRALSVGFLLTCLFYLNYITLLFAPALAVAMAARYRTQPNRQLVKCGLIALLVFAILIAPQLHTMIAIQLPDSGSQRTSILISLARLVLALSASEALLPWQPIALTVTALFGVLALAALVARLRPPQAPIAATPTNLMANGNLDGPLLPTSHEATGTILLFALLFFALVASCGLGGKPRNGLVLVPLVALAAAVAITKLRPRVQSTALVIFVVWIVLGALHELRRYGMTKASMNDRPQQALAFIRETAGSACPLVITYDAGLSFALSQSRIPGLILGSGTGDPIFFSGQEQVPALCASIRLYAVRSYLGETNPLTALQASEMESAMHFILGTPRVNAFSRDPDAGAKRRLAAFAHARGGLADAAQLPDYRYTIYSGPITPGMEPDLEKSMPDFIWSSAGAPAKP